MKQIIEGKCPACRATVTLIVEDWNCETTRCSKCYNWLTAGYDEYDSGADWEGYWAITVGEEPVGW